MWWRIRGSAWTQRHIGDGYHAGWKQWFVGDAADIQEVALSWKCDGVFQEPEAFEIDEYQSDDDDDDDDFRAEVDFYLDIRGADDIWIIFNKFNLYLFWKNPIFIFYLFGFSMNTI